MSEPRSMREEDSQKNLFNFDTGKELDKVYKKKTSYENKILKKQLDALDREYKRRVALIEQSGKSFDEQAQLLLELDEELAKKKKQVAEEIELTSDKRAQLRADTVNKLLNTNLDKNFTKLLLVAAVGSNLTDKLDSAMDSFLNDQSAIAYNLNGTGASISDIAKNLSSALNGTGIVRYEEVYKNLKTLVQEGIIYDAEQRAYLMTLSDDLGMNFNMQSASLNRLINLQRVDLADNRMAIQASLKTFLNLNYQTSQYIKEGFESVSDALIEAQSIMDASSASALETVVQKWMGSLSSVGAATSTVNSLAEALGNLGSGNISALNGTAMQRLIVLGANKAGKSYGDLITTNLSSDTVNSLMSGISQVVNDMIGSSGNNAVRSELARVFGLNVSDVVAFQNLSSIGVSGSLTNDINDALLKDADDYVYVTTLIKNTLDNFIYAWGANIASNPTYYAVQKGIEYVSELSAAVIDGLLTGGTIAPLGLGINWNIDLGSIAKLVPVVTSLGGLIPQLSSVIGNIGLSFAGNAASSIYSSLGSSSKLSMTSSGNVSGYSDGTSVSGAVVLNTNTDDSANMIKNSGTQKLEEINADETKEINEKDTKTADDIYKLIESYFDDYLSNSFLKEVAIFKDNLPELSHLSNIESTVGSIASSVSSIYSAQSNQSGVNLSAIESYLSTISSKLDNIKSSSGGGTATFTQTYASSNVKAIAIDSTTTDYIKDAMQITALNSQNIYNLLELWYQSNTNNTQYTKYNTNFSGTALKGSKYSVFQYNSSTNKWS